MRGHFNSMGMRVIATTIAALLLTTGIARAESSDATAKAKQLYEDGLTNYNLGHYTEALTSFEQAYRLRHDPIFLFNIGQCQRQLRRYEDAERSYRAFLRESTDVQPTMREQVHKLISEMEAAVADERAKQPPPGTMPPKEAQSTAPTTSTPATTTAPTAQPENATRADLTAQAAPAHQEKPVYKRGWFWGVVVGAVVVVGVGVGVGVALGTSKSNNPFPAVQF